MLKVIAYNSLFALDKLHQLDIFLRNLTKNNMLINNKCEVKFTNLFMAT